MENKTLLFEQLTRIHEIMNHSKKQVINEQVWKSLAKVLDSAVAGAKFLDTAVMDAAKAVKAAAGDAAKLRAISSFLTRIENSATDLAKLDEIADDVVENFDNASKTRLNSIDDSMELAIKEQGSVTDDLLRQYRRRLDNELQFDPALGPIKEKIINKQVNKWKTRSGFGGGTAAAEQTLRLPGGVRSFDEVLTSVNNTLKNEVPPKSITKEQLTKIGKDVDDLTAKFERGEISFKDIESIFKNNTTTLETLTQKAANFKTWYGGLWDIITTLVKEPGTAGTKLILYFKQYGPNLIKGIFWFFLSGVLIFSLTIVGTGLWNWADDKNMNPFSDNATGAEEFGDQNWTCIKSIPGVNKLDENGIIELAKIKINNAKLGCANTAMDAPDNIFVTGISVEPGTTGDPRAVIKLDFKDGTSKKYVGGKEIGGGTTPPPTPGNCVWKTEDDAKNAVKGGVKLPAGQSVNDADITVDLAACSVKYKHPILGEKSYTPANFE